MPRKRQSELYFSNAEIEQNLKNALLVVQRPKSIKDLPAARMARLKEFCKALIAPFGEMIEEEALKPEELRFILVAAALLAHGEYCID